MNESSSPTADPDERLFTAADALRDLIDLFCDRELPGDLLDEITDQARHFSAEIDRAPRWDRQAALERGVGEPDVHEGRRVGFPHRAVAGIANPAADPMVLDFDFDAGLLTTTVTLRARHSGAPGRGHGGILAAIFDEFAGATVRLAGTSGATARLCVDYRAPIPLDVPLTLRGWIHHREDRKVVVRGTAHRGEDLIGEMEGLFITIDYGAIDTSGEARH